jgi:signal transduction histidine kinase
LNENLEQLVSERTKRIDAQLNQISKYAYMNAHEVRGPVARILGLMNLIKNETDPVAKEDLINKLDATSIELDTIVREMNRLLEQEAN